ncbi:LysR family transcriptional regulator [Pseudoroseicyclus tamaricis]|uniref:LysR family transcriptional regulator n=2 Tax=Pseudoroseicyclus tamaricis TaxID=2705421 RepID=A0A6B2JG20_9RHOB|nr:LysR family transcriptional regulator [Pseudoroseicyclus tamaricis]NDV00081.1 LysR family transcriptional regulator [Pseudoroseicyclus tamaricis]
MKDAPEPAAADRAESDAPRAPRSGSGPTLHQLRIFRAVARAETLTRAAKDLGLTQPTLSLQLGKLESTVGTRLFHRRPGEMALTEAGEFLLPHVEQMLRILTEAEDGMARFRGGYQSVLRLAGLDSVLRGVLPVAVGQMQAAYPDISFDIRESAPAEVVELLHARRINIGLVAANSLGGAAGAFEQLPIMEDPYVLVVPDGLDLDGVRDPDVELSAAQRAVLRRSVHFVFGSSHGTRVSDWYDRLLPGHSPIAHCRSFDTALSFVRAGTGVCIAPALATLGGAAQLEGVRRYRIDVPPRRILALLLAQQRRLEPVATLVSQLQEAGAAWSFDGVRRAPPFLSTPLPGGAG